MYFAFTQTAATALSDFRSEKLVWNCWWKGLFKSREQFKVQSVIVNSTSPLMTLQNSLVINCNFVFCLLVTRTINNHVTLSHFKQRGYAWTFLLFVKTRVTPWFLKTIVLTRVIPWFSFRPFYCYSQSRGLKPGLKSMDWFSYSFFFVLKKHGGGGCGMVLYLGFKI